MAHPSEARPSVPSATGVAVLRGLPARTGPKTKRPTTLRHGVGRARRPSNRVFSAVLPCRIDLSAGRLGTRAARRQAWQSIRGRSSPAWLSPENKNRVTVATPGAANPGRDSLEARGTLKTSPQTVKADHGSSRTLRRSIQPLGSGLVKPEVTWLERQTNRRRIERRPVNRYARR